ncbi:MAG: hypothetical protein ACTHU0_26830 [Kofleriaceae bacterium]
MSDEKHAHQQLGRTEVDELEIARLEARILEGSPLPWAYNEDGRIVSAPLEREWEGAERMPDNDPRWRTLSDPTVAFVTPALHDAGQGDRDAMLIVDACNALPRILRRLRRLEKEHATREHMHTLRKGPQDLARAADKSRG